MLKNVTLALLIVGSSHFLMGQRAFSPGLGDPFLDSWRVKEISELNDLLITSINNGNNGKMLISHTGGIVIYDGYNWQRTPYSGEAAGGEFCRKIIETNKGFYILKRTGLYLFADNKWQTIFQNSKAFPQVFVDIIKLSDNSLMIGSNVGVFYLKGDKGYVYASNQKKEQLNTAYPWLNFVQVTNNNVKRNFRAYALLEQTPGKVLLFNKDFGVMHANISQNPNNPLEIVFTGDTIWATHFSYAYKDSKNNVWISCEATEPISPITCFTNNGRRLDYYPSRQFNVPNKTADIAELDDGTMVFGGHNCIYTVKNNVFKRYSKPELPLTQQTIKLAVDIKGNLWAASFRGKIFMLEYNSERLKKYNNLAFQLQEKNKKKWFISKDYKLVYEHHNQWHFYDTHDGLMQYPQRLIKTAKGDYWCFGSNNNTAAIAYLQGNTWHTSLLNGLAWNIEKKSVYEDKNGDIWLGAIIFPNGKGGVIKLSYDSLFNINTTHYHGLISNSYGGILQDYNGKIINGSFFWIWSLADTNFTPLTEVAGRGPVTSLVHYSDSAWIAGAFELGVYVRHKDSTIVYTEKDGLLSNSVLSVAPNSDSTFYVATEKGFSYFDAKNHSGQLFPEEFAFSGNASDLKWCNTSASLWINKIPVDWVYKYPSGNKKDINEAFFSIEYKKDTIAPNTVISQFPEAVQHKGGVYISWKGHDAWNTTPVSELSYSYKLNNAPWSKFISDTGYYFNKLSAGRYHLQVRARDADMNIEPVPAGIRFKVYPPAVLRAWFIALNAFLLIVIIYLAGNLIKRNKTLTKLNKDLNTANKQLVLNNKQITEQNDALQASEEETMQLNEELQTTNELLVKQKEELTKALNKLQQTQLQLISSEKLATIGLLTAGVAHEINNPLNFILGSATAIEDYVETNLPEHKAGLLIYLNMIEEGIERASKIVSSLNHFNHRSEGMSELFDIHDLLNNCLTILQSKLKEKTTLNKEYCTSQCIVQGNEGRLHQVFINLLLNAEQSIKDTGSITITTSANHDYVHIVISDTGVGIPKHSISKITEPFFTTKDPGDGTGLGLSISAQILKEHKGVLHFESTVGKGTSVSVKLPVKK